MKKYCSIVLILFASLMCTLSYASDDSISGEKTFKPSEVDTPPRVIKAIPPIFPINKTTGGLIITQGRVTLRFIVTKDGGVRNPEVIEAEPEGIFEASAIEAVKNYKFAPATKNGEPVDCIAKIPMSFNVAGPNTPFDPYLDSEKGFNFIKVAEYDKAIESFNEAISKGYSPAYSGRGVAYMNLKDYKKAIEDFNAAIRLSGSIEHIFLLERHIFGELSEDHKKTIKRKFAFNYKLRGDVYSAMKNYKKSIKDYNYAIEIDPEMLAAYFERGNAFSNLDKYRKAIADYTKVIELDNTYLQAYSNRAVAYNKLNDSERMCLDLKKACDLGDCKGLELAKPADKCSADMAGN